VHTIAFNLGGCPSVIYLASPLPALTSTVIVDGYTQPGSFPNDSDTVFDASLCVLIKPATAATSAFRVASNANGGGNASLTLRGVGLGGFGQDVILLGGANHVIVGNQFGGIANGVVLGNSSLSDITIGVDADSFEIGSGAANRNLIGGSTAGNGINVQSVSRATLITARSSTTDRPRPGWPERTAERLRYQPQRQWLRRRRQPHRRQFDPSTVDQQRA
jgi:hypothetical protein